MDKDSGALNPGDSPSPDFQTSGNLISTVERALPPQPPAEAETDPAGANNTGGQTDTDGQPPKDTDKDGGDGNADRFDQHPRFQELLQRAKDAERRGREAEERYLAMERRMASLEQQPPAGPQAKSILDLTDEELIAMSTENPREYLRMLSAQVTAEVGQVVGGHLNQQSESRQIEAAFADFERQHADFGELMANGDIDRYLKAHPFENHFSAYHALTASKQEEATKAAVEKAVKEAEEKWRKQQAAKQGAQVLGGGPASGSRAGHLDPALQDTKKFGGATSVLAARLAAMRAQGGG